MEAIRRAQQARRFAIVLPLPQLDCERLIKPTIERLAGRKLLRRGGVQRRYRAAHEAPKVAFKLETAERGVEISKVEMRQLRLNAIHAGRGFEGFNHMIQERRGVPGRRCARMHKKAANQPFFAFIEKKAIALHSLAIHQRIARKPLIFKAGADQAGGRRIIPAKRFEPSLGFGRKQWSEALRFKVTDVDDLRHIDQGALPAEPKPAEPKRV